MICEILESAFLFVNLRNLRNLRWLLWLSQKRYPVHHGFVASFDYNVEPELGRIQAPVLAILFADDELNPPEAGGMSQAMARVKSGRLLLVPAGPHTEGHRTQVKAAVWREALRPFLKGLPAR